MESELWNMSGECKYEKNEILWKSKNIEPNMCLESVNQITVWRVNPETWLESVSMKKINFFQNSKILNLTCAWRV